MLIKNLSYDCNKVGSFLNVFRVFRYLNIYVPKGVRSNPLNPPPPLSYASESILQHKCARYSRSRIYGGPQLSRQKQKLHGNNKIPHGKIKYYTAKAKQLWFCSGYLLLPWGIWFLLWSIWFCREVFHSLVLPWGLWFCREVFCFCSEVFVFAVRFSVLAWGILFLPWGFWFCVRFLVLPWQLGATVMRSSPGCDTWLHPPPPATIPQCSWFLNLGGIHVVFAMLKAKDKKNFCWLFICFLLGKTEFCMYNDLIQRTNDSIWIIHEALVTKFRVYMLKTFLTHRWWMQQMQSLHPLYAQGTIPYPFLSFPIPFLVLLSAHNSFNVITPPWHPCTV